MTGQEPPEQIPVTPDDSLMPPTAPPASAPAAPRAKGGSREPYAVVVRPRNECHGKRLTAAFEALELFPALAESRNRLLAIISEEHPSTGEGARATGCP